jgi:transcriptional regulator with XRE-family HTH domain
MQRTERAVEGKPAMVNGLGEFLRRERELRHISLDEVAERTKISRRYLEGRSCAGLSAHTPSLLV